MKKLFFLLTFCEMSRSLFTQSTFNEKTFNDLMTVFIKDPVPFFKTQTAPDFIFLDRNGKVNAMADVMALFNNSKADTWAFTNVKTRQYGSTGIVISDFDHTHQIKGGPLLVIKEQLTSTFSEQKGQWTLVSWSTNIVKVIRPDEEVAIKAVIEKETKAFHDRDAATLVSCHANVDCVIWRKSMVNG